MTDTRVHVSVVIPCYNGRGILERQLDALLRQRVDFSWEVVVADNGSTDGSAEIVRSYENREISIRVCDASKNRGINHARNVGVRASYGQFVVLCDADDEVADDWLSRMNGAFRSGSGLVGGRLIRVSEHNFEIVTGESGLRDDLAFLPWPAGANCGFSRSVFEGIGGFDENYRRGGDETDFFWRGQLAGHRLMYVHDATVRYADKSPGIRRFRQHFYYGRSHAQLYRQFRGSGMPRASIRDVLRAWSQIMRTAFTSIIRPDQRPRLVAHVAQRLGRLRGSVAYRVFYA